MTEPDSRLVLRVNGARYERWKQVRVSRGIEQIAGSFELVLADGWALSGDPLPALVGQVCEVLIDNQPIITGHIDAVDVGYDANRHDLILRGRDNTADLVDCAAFIDGQGWQNSSLLRVARDLCKPYGIAVVSDLPADTAFRSARISPGETVAEVLSRGAAVAGGLLISYGRGQLHLSRAGTGRANTVLKRGVNILANSSREDSSQRFASYQVIGQGSEAGGLDAIAQQQVLATATDAGARANRRRVIVVSDDLDNGKAQQLANWHAANALARGRNAEVRVRGWMDGARPWQLNTLVRVVDPWARMDGDYLIAGIGHGLDDTEGQVTTLSVAPREAYVPEPVVDLEALA